MSFSASTPYRITVGMSLAPGQRLLMSLATIWGWYMMAATAPAQGQCASWPACSGRTQRKRHTTGSHIIKTHTHWPKQRCQISSCHMLTSIRLSLQQRDSQTLQQLQCTELHVLPGKAKCSDLPHGQPLSQDPDRCVREWPSGGRRAVWLWFSRGNGTVHNWPWKKKKQWNKLKC